MAWRGQGASGSNNIPLGSRRRFDGESGSPEDASSGYNPSQPTIDYASKRGRSPTRRVLQAGPSCRSTTDNTLASEDVDAAIDGLKRRKKRNRWGDAQENKAAGLMGLPTAIMANMTAEQLEAYTLHLRIEEISQKLRINDVVPADGDR